MHATGRLATDGPPVTPDTVYDVASLTKVVATLPCILHLAERGEIGLDDPVARFLPDFDRGQDRVTVRHLLSHTSGLPDGQPFYALPGDASDRWRAVRTASLVGAPGAAMVYSDIGFMLLGLIVETVSGAGLDDVAAKVVFEPLGMASTRFRPPESWRDRIAATERDSHGIAKVGVVHDENAESLGGVAGHAGLFSTGPDIARYIESWLEPDQSGPRREALRCQTAGLTGPARPADVESGTAPSAFVPARRGLGWTLRGDRWDHMGTVWPGSGAGHTGFTGTSVGFDPVSGAWAVLLTNGVHLGRDARVVVGLRRAVHDAIATG